MRTLLLPARLMLLPLKLATYPVRRRRRRGSAESDFEAAAEIVDAIEDLADLGGLLDADDAVDAAEAVIEEAAGRSRKGRAARGFLLLLLVGLAIGVALYFLRQRRDFEYARLEPEPERPDLSPVDFDDPSSDLGDSDEDDEDDGTGPAATPEREAVTP